MSQSESFSFTRSLPFRRASTYEYIARNKLKTMLLSAATMGSASPAFPPPPSTAQVSPPSPSIAPEFPYSLSTALASPFSPLCTATTSTTSPSPFLNTTSLVALGLTSITVWSIVRKKRNSGQYCYVEEYIYIYIINDWIYFPIFISVKEMIPSQLSALLISLKIHNEITSSVHASFPQKYLFSSSLFFVFLTCNVLLPWSHLPTCKSFHVNLILPIVKYTPKVLTRGRKL